jgi:hypothetical protein
MAKAKKVAETPKDLIIEGNMDFTITISNEGYLLETKNSIDNDVAAMLHSRSVIEMIKKDCEMTKKSPMFKMFDSKQKKMYNDRYDKLIHASYILGTISGELLMKAMYASDRKD